MFTKFFFGLAVGIVAPDIKERDCFKVREDSICLMFNLAETRDTLRFEIIEPSFPIQHLNHKNTWFHF